MILSYILGDLVGLHKLSYSLRNSVNRFDGQGPPPSRPKLRQALETYSADLSRNQFQSEVVDNANLDAEMERPELLKKS